MTRPTRDVALALLVVAAALDLAWLVTHSRAAAWLGVEGRLPFGVLTLAGLHLALGLGLLPPPPSCDRAGVKRALGWWLAPRPMLAGVVAGFLLCALGGRALEGATVLDPFQRFTYALGFETGYLPTPPQLLELARRRLPKDRIGVIVGGTSVFAGTTQRAGHVWTEALARRLGDRFAVLNLATRYGSPMGFGLTTARMLQREHPRLVYVCDVLPHGNYAPDGNHRFRHLGLAARARGLVEVDAAEDAALAAWRRGQPSTGDLAEERLCAELDRSLRFSDLWSAATLHGASTTWSPAVGFAARATLEDPEPLTAPLAERARRVSPLELLVVRQSIPGVLGPVREMALEDAVEAAFPADIRRLTLCAVEAYDPLHIELAAQTDPRLRDLYHRARWRTAERLRAHGLRATLVGGAFTPADFSDRVHLSEAGGEKLAAELAGQVEALAAELGYLAR